MYLPALLIVTVVTFAAANPVTQSRVYDPEEDDPNRHEFLLMADDEGHIHYEDLRNATPTITAYSSPSDVTFYLYTRNNPRDAYVVSAADPARISASGSPFNRNRKSVFIAHGWTSNGNAQINVLIRDASLHAEDVNVFAIDWSGPASGGYISARGRVPGVGQIVGGFVLYLEANVGVNLANVKLVGHSLGAHLVGCAGKATNGRVGSMVGLDPAGPLYTVSNRNVRIDASDALMVQVIHTNGGLLGFNSALGDADFYPNGGKSQPGCGIDIAGGCAHSRAYEFYAESVKSSGFLALNCDSYNNFNNGRCQSNSRSQLGQLRIDRSNHGDFFLRTNDKAPYALGSL